MKRVIISFIIIISIFSIINGVSAEVQTLNSIPQNRCIQLVQSYANSTYSNLTKIQYPDKSLRYLGVLMEKHGVDYNYTFCDTSSLGEYIASICTDVDGVEVCVSYDFNSTPGGLIDTLGIYFIALVIIIGVIFLGFSIREPWFVIIGGMLSMIFGVYSINYGISGFRDMNLTWAIGLFEIAIGAFLAISSGIQKIDE